MGTRFSSRWLCILAATLALPIPLVAAQGDAGDAVADDAQADDAAPGEAEAGGRDAEARDLFNAGRRAFSDGRFAEALERYENRLVKSCIIKTHVVDERRQKLIQSGLRYLAGKGHCLFESQKHAPRMEEQVRIDVLTSLLYSLMLSLLYS